MAANSQAQLESRVTETVDDVDTLSSARVMIIGAGALGSVAAGNLASSGVGLIGLVDERKAETLAAKLGALHPGVQADAYPARLESANAEPIIAGHDLVIDCSNSNETRLTVNEACIALRIPLVIGALAGSDGSVTTIRPGTSACCRCIGDLFDVVDPPSPAGARAAERPLAWVIGSLEAVEAVKLLTGEGVPLLDRILRADLLALSFEETAVARRIDCPSCGDL